MEVKMKTAFTLSEVIITIGVIGVVSAMTLPAVINKINDHHFKTAYKKAYSDLSNVLQRAVSEDAIDLSAKNYYSSLKPYFKAVKSCENDNAFDCWVDADRVCTGTCNGNKPDKYSKMFIDTSGRAWGEYYWGDNILLVDTNGSKGPNQFGKDRWVFGYKTQNGMPIKVVPTMTDGDIKYPHPWCNHPPCYYHSWLYK